MCVGLILWKNHYRYILWTIALLFLITVGYALINLSFSYGDLDYKSILGYFDIYVNAANYYNDYLNGSINLFNGDIISSSYWSWLPRTFFSDKPYVYGILNINEIYYPGAAETGNTPAFGGGVKDFADFGFIGIFLYSFFDFNTLTYFYFMKLVSNRNSLFSTQNINILELMTLIVLFSPRFGDQILGPAYLAFILLCILLLFIFKIRFNFNKIALKI